MLNFGAHFDPQQYLEVDEAVKIYIIDAHKPVLLENCYMDSNVLVWDDGDIEKQTDIEQAFRGWHEEEDRRRQEEQNSDEDEDDGAEPSLNGDDTLEEDVVDSDTDADEENTPEMDIINANGKRRSRSGSTYGDDDRNDDGDSHSDSSDSPPKRRRTGQDTHIPPSPDQRTTTRDLIVERRKAHEKMPQCFLITMIEVSGMASL